MYIPGFVDRSVVHVISRLLERLDNLAGKMLYAEYVISSCAGARGKSGSAGAKMCLSINTGKSRASTHLISKKVCLCVSIPAPRQANTRATPASFGVGDLPPPHV